MLSYHDFREGTKGRIIVDLIARPDTIAEMERRSRRHEPAVAAIDRAIIDEVGRLNGTERQHAGRVVRDVLAPLGWHPTRRKRLREGHVFTSGAVYESVAPQPAARLAGTPGVSGSREARIDEAIAILEASRDQAKPRDTVDAFLRERRAMWGED